MRFQDKQEQHALAEQHTTRSGLGPLQQRLLRRMAAELQMPPPSAAAEVQAELQMPPLSAAAELQALRQQQMLPGRQQ